MTRVILNVLFGLSTFTVVAFGLQVRSKGYRGGWRKKSFQLLGGTICLLTLCVSAFSQGSAGRIFGTVIDQSGGVIADATVSVVDTARGVTRTLNTDSAGEYNAPNLIPGSYLVRAEAKVDSRQLIGRTW